MGTDAGVRFEASQETVNEMSNELEELNFIVNDTGLGVSCTPYIWNHERTYHLVGQTHRSHKNGVVLLREMKRWIKANKFDIQIVNTWEI